MNTPTHQNDAAVSESELSGKLAAALCTRCALGDKRTRQAYTHQSMSGKFCWVHLYPEHTFKSGAVLEKGCTAGEILEILIGHEAAHIKVRGGALLRRPASPQG